MNTREANADTDTATATDTEFCFSYSSRKVRQAGRQGGWERSMLDLHISCIYA